MLSNLQNRFFPMPRFLSMPSFGLDISDESIKFIELVTARNGIKVNKYGEKKIEPGIIESGKIKDLVKLGEILTELKRDEGIKSVRVSLPEEQVYLFRLRLEKINLTNIRESIELSLEDHIPIPAEEVIFDYEILEEDNKYLDLEVTAITKSIIESYLSVFQNASISAQSFELEAQAIIRSVLKKGDLGTYMIVDFGQRRTGISIVSRGIVTFTSTLDLGGATLTDMVKKNFKISFEEAEKMKREYGLQRNNVNKELFLVLLNGVSILRDEISKHFMYWHTHKEEDGKEMPSIRKIILCGGDSNLIGLSEYFSVSMKTKVEIADVWVNILDKEKFIPEMNFDTSLSFATALGLALGGFYHD